MLLCSACTDKARQSMFLGQERRAVRRRLKHVSLGKDDDVWPPSTAPHPVHEYSGMDEDKVAILIVSPAKVCPDCKGPKTEQIPMFDDSAARVDEFLSAQHTIEATTTKLQMISHHYSTSTGTMTGERNADANARGTSSGRSIYLHPNAPINPDSASSIHFQFTPAPGCYKAREASIDMVERFFAPVSKEPKAEPTKRTRPLKAKIAGFEEHSKRGLKRKQRPESLSNHSTVYVTTKALRSPLSPCSRNVGASIGRRFSHRDGHGSPKISSTAGVSDPYSAERSQISSYMPSTLDIQDQENLHPDTEEPAQTQFSPAYSIPSQPSLIHSPTHNPGQKPWNYDFSFASQVPVPVPPSTVPNTPCQPFSQSKQQQRRGPVVFTEEGLGKAMVYSLNKNTNDETSKEKSPSSVSMDSLKAKEYLRHLNEHVENLCQERDQAVQRAGVLEKEVVRLRLNVRMLERELNGPAQRDLQGKDEPALRVK